MLITLIRVFFVIFAIFIGHDIGPYFYGDLFGGRPPSWVGVPVGFSLAITLIAAEQAFRKHFSRSLVAFILGISGGLLLAGLTLWALRIIISEQLYDALSAPIALISVYLVLNIVVHHIDRFRIIIPFVEFQAERSEHGRLLLDSTALRDGRLVPLIQAGLLGQRLIVHRSVILACEQLSASDQKAQQVQGQRALDALNELRALQQCDIEINETEIPNATTERDTLVRLARLENTRLLCNDRDLTNMAQAENIHTVFLNDLASAFVPTIAPGEHMSITIENAGDNPGQGISHLDDGSMVIVTDAAERIGERIDCTIIRLHHSSNGRMIFCEPK